ncbi:glycosyltransferase family 25 protein [Glaciecola petra]|uniref:Glycosyltransferase family 25 protein n=1 Tax=Glaciecola petra TaxID=3075602 RepID=A0ABU2ZUW3_9ALTE|nr:glycosyltransferase family 25 protein [Aestuariibacter sp. P117]MDT0596431.1 glycosyltransferase family 25 protein [Aestuariibacter sp. P117]
MPLIGNHELLLINLDRSKDRLARSIEQLTKYDLDYIRIPAVDGEQLSEQAIQTHTKADYRDYYKTLRVGEIGCYLSHRKCWERVLEKSLDYAIILEDDFVLEEDLGSLPELLSNIEQSWDCIKLLEYPEKRNAVQSFAYGDKTLFRYDKIPSRTCAYVISKSGASKMLKHSEKVGRPVDIDFQYWWESDIQVFGLKPYLVSVNTNEVSTIESPNSTEIVGKSVVKQFVQKWYFLYANNKYLKRVLNKR